MKNLAVFDISGTSVKGALVNEIGEIFLPIQFKTSWGNDGFVYYCH